MSIRKLPEENRRLKRLTTLIEQCLWHAIRLRYPQFDMHLASIDITKDLRLARIKVFSLSLSQDVLLKTLHTLRVPIQKLIANHQLRHTPVLQFLWDDESLFFYKALNEPSAFPDVSAESS